MISDKTNVRGFSLIELMVVITIISAVAALVGPSLFKQVNNIQIKSDERKLVQTLKQLSHKAFLSGKSITIQFERKRIGYFYDDQPEKQAYKDFTFIQFDEQVLRLNKNGFIQPETVHVLSADVIDYLNVTEVNIL